MKICSFILELFHACRQIDRQAELFYKCSALLLTCLEISDVYS
jgi:hypothetical protein